MNLNERIKKIIDIKCQGNVSDFTRKTGLSTGFLSKIKDSAQPKTINKIIDKYPDVNKIWLLTGEGEMLKGESVVEEPPPDYRKECEICKEKDKIIEAQKKTIEAYENTIELQKQLIESLKSASGNGQKRKAG